MSLHVLCSREEIRNARRVMAERGIDCVSRGLPAFLRRWRIIPGVNVGDTAKSWDVLNTTELLEKRLKQADPILDLGAYASEILLNLERLGFRNLTGIDCNPRLAAMPFHERIRYVVGDFYRSGFPAASFAAITAISVIEHGFNQEGLLAELGRLLKPGGLFVASVDYWPDKVDTTGVNAFGLDWRIFSAGELQDLFVAAENHGLELLGDCSFSAGEPLIHWGGRRYTFAWFALVKKDAGR